ncbi:MAG: hypothetical protein AB8G26_02340 [Ilumatobacter sp.]
MNKLIATIAISTIAVSACGLTTVSKQDLRDQLVEDGIPAEMADCVVDELDEQLTDDEFQEVAKADDIAEVDSDLGDRAFDIVSNCALDG